MNAIHARSQLRYWPTLVAEPRPQMTASEGWEEIYRNPPRRPDQPACAPKGEFQPDFSTFSYRQVSSANGPSLVSVWSIIVAARRQPHFS
jgi:hypothetical protein